MLRLKKLKLRSPVGSCFFFFLCAGAVYAQIAARLPELKQQINIHDGQRGSLLFCMGVGSLLGFLLAGSLCRFFESKWLLRVSCISLLIVSILIGFASSFEFLCVFFFLLGLSTGIYDVCMNTQAINLELTFRQNYLSLMHACYSIGCLLGSFLSACLAFASFSLGLSFSLVGIVFFCAFLLLQTYLINDIKRSETKLVKNERKKPLPFS